jgi:hypothetical protein
MWDAVNGRWVTSDGGFFNEVTREWEYPDEDLLPPPPPPMPELTPPKVAARVSVNNEDDDDEDYQFPPNFAPTNGMCSMQFINPIRQSVFFYFLFFYFFYFIFNFLLLLVLFFIIFLQILMMKSKMIPDFRRHRRRHCPKMKPKVPKTPNGTKTLAHGSDLMAPCSMKKRKNGNMTMTVKSNH